MNELAHSREGELQALMSAGLDGDAAAYHQLLERLTCHLLRLLRAPLRTNRARSDGGGGPAARNSDRLPYSSSYIRSVATFHALDPCDRALQVSGLSASDEIFLQGHSDGERARSDGDQRRRGSRERIGFGAAHVEHFVQGETGDLVRETGRTER